MLPFQGFRKQICAPKKIISLWKALGMATKIDKIWSPDPACDGENERRDRLVSITLPMSIWSRSSQETFSLSAKNAICGTYGRRCVICLTHTPTIQCASIIDSDATRVGENQVCHKIPTRLLSLSVPQRRIATELGILPPDYQKNSAGNGLPRQWQSLVVL
jgi:hypothetical protein